MTGKYDMRRIVPALIALLAVSAVMSIGAAEEANSSGSSSGADAAREQNKALLERKLNSCEAQTSGGAASPKTGKERARFRMKMEPYPSGEELSGNQAVIQVSFLADALGNPRFPHVWRTFPDKPDEAFLESALAMTQRAKLEPAQLKGAPIASWVTVAVKYTLQEPGTGYWPMGRLLNQKAWNTYLERANNGDVKAAALTAYVAVMVPGETGLSVRGEDSLLIQSALDGSTFSRMELIRRLSLCQQSASLDPWLFNLADAGVPDAKVHWAVTLMNSHDESLNSKVVELLHQVSQSSDEFMRLWVAGLLATTPDDAIRDPAAALLLAKSLNGKPGPGHKNDPDYLEVLAAADAANGDYAGAISAEKAAITYAQERRWQVMQLQARLASYQASQPWRGYLCDCERLSPGEN